jgi:hypothetical protein
MGISNIVYIGAKKLQKQDASFSSAYRKIQEIYTNASDYQGMSRKLNALGFQSEDSNPYDFQAQFNGQKVKLRFLPANIQDRKLLIKSLQSMVEFYSNDKILTIIDIKEKNNQNLFFGGYLLYSQGDADEKPLKLESLDFKTLKTFENKLYGLLNTKNSFSDNLINPNTWSLVDGTIVTDAFLHMRNIHPNEKDNMKDNIHSFFVLLREKIAG